MEQEQEPIQNELPESLVPGQPAPEPPKVYAVALQIMVMEVPPDADRSKPIRLRGAVMPAQAVGTAADLAEVFEKKIIPDALEYGRRATGQSLDVKRPGLWTPDGSRRI